MDRTITIEPSSTWSIRGRSLRKCKYSSCPGRILQSCLTWREVSFDLQYGMERTWVSYDGTLNCTERRSSTFPVTSVYQGVVIEVTGIMATDRPFETRKPSQRRQWRSLDVIVGLVVQRLTCLLDRLEKLVDAFSRIPSSDIAQTWKDQLGFFYGELEMIV